MYSSDFSYWSIIRVCSLTESLYIHAIVSIPAFHRLADSMLRWIQWLLLAILILSLSLHFGSLAVNALSGNIRNLRPSALNIWRFQRPLMQLPLYPNCFAQLDLYLTISVACSYALAFRLVIYSSSSMGILPFVEWGTLRSLHCTSCRGDMRSFSHFRYIFFFSLPQIHVTFVRARFLDATDGLLPALTATYTHVRN